METTGIADVMQAAVLHAPGDLRIDHVPVPEALGEDEVLVRVGAAGVCGSDVARVMVTGTYRFPAIPGHEMAGRVEAVGSAVGSVAPGDRVAVAPLIPCGGCTHCAKGQYSVCDDYDFLGSRSDGGFAEYVRAPARNLVRLPDNVGDDVAATVEPAAVVLHGIHKVNLGLGDAVVVIGAGALGFFAVQLARLSGARPVIAVDTDQQRLALGAQVGADVVVNPGKEDAVAAVRAATAGRGAALSIEAAGSDRARDLAIRAAAKQGTVLLLGSAHGTITFDGPVFEALVRRELRIVGSWNSYSVPFPGREWHEITELYRAGTLIAEPLISHRLPLKLAPDAFRKLNEGSFGPHQKILFKPNG